MSVYCSLAQQLEKFPKINKKSQESLVQQIELIDDYN